MERIFNKFLIALTIIVFTTTFVNGQDLFFIGENSYPCTKSVTLESNYKAFITHDPNISFAKDKSEALFAISVETNGDVLIQGKLIIYLDDGSVISLVDKDKTDYVDDIAYAVYYLSDEDLIKLKRSNINTVRYRLEGDDEASTEAFGGNYSASNKNKFDFPSLASKFFN